MTRAIRSCATRGMILRPVLVRGGVLSPTGRFPNGGFAKFAAEFEPVWTFFGESLGLIGAIGRNLSVKEQRQPLMAVQLLPPGWSISGVPSVRLLAGAA